MQWTKTQSNTRNTRGYSITIYPSQEGGDVRVVAKKMIQEKKGQKGEKEKEGKRQEAGEGILGKEGRKGKKRRIGRREK